MRSILLVLLLTIPLACHRNEATPTGTPACITQLIEQNSRQQTGLGLIAIYRYTYRKQYVYLSIADCCDRYNVLLDQSCNALCSPSGGFAGIGDGKCPDFFKEATDATLLWQRPR